jgi:hypothetical protein
MERFYRLGENFWRAELGRMGHGAWVGVCDVCSSGEMEIKGGAMGVESGKPRVTEISSLSAVVPDNSSKTS